MMKTNLNLTRISNISRAHEPNYGSVFTPIQVPGEKVIEMFKKGHKIHIKKKNRGSFTRWCGGNVTEECIRRGKNSSNPAIRKKATFAANARKWNKG